MALFGKNEDEVKDESAGTGNETIDKNLSDAEAAAAAKAAEDEQRQADAEETARIEKEAKKLGGEYVRCIVSHATNYSNGVIHICGGAHQFNITRIKPATAAGCTARPPIRNTTLCATSPAAWKTASTPPCSN